LKLDSAFDAKHPGKEEQAMNTRRYFKLLAFGMGLLSIPVSATAQSAAMNVLSPATVIAKGAGVDVSVEVFCELPDLSSRQVNISVFLAQRIGNGITTGNGSNQSLDQIRCDGGRHRFEILVTGLTRYKAGSAVAQGSASFFSPEGFLSAQQLPIQIQLVNAKK
jgi:hypothetical protein